MIYGLLQQLQALGLDVPTVLSQLGVKGENVKDVVGKSSEVIAKGAEAAVKPVESKPSKASS